MSNILMRFRSPKSVFFGLLALVSLFCSCGKDGKAQQAATEPVAGEKSKVEDKLGRISVAEIGKLRSRVGKREIVFGKVSGTSISGSGHHFLNFSSGFKVICLKGDVGKFSKGGPAAMYRGQLVEVRGEIATHQGKPQIGIESPDQVKVIDLAKAGGGGSDGAAKKFEVLEVAANTWVSPAGMRYSGRDAQGLTRKAHVLRHAQDQPDRPGSHGVFDANGDEVFKVIDEAWGNIEKKNLRPRTEADSQTYTVPMGRRVGYLGGKNGARRNHPALHTVFIVVRRGTQEVITAFPK